MTIERCPIDMPEFLERLTAATPYPDMVWSYSDGTLTAKRGDWKLSFYPIITTYLEIKIKRNDYVNELVRESVKAYVRHLIARNGGNVETKTIKIYTAIKDPEPLVFQRATGYTVDDDGTLIVKNNNEHVCYFASWAWARYDVIDEFALGQMMRFTTGINVGR